MNKKVPADDEKKALPALAPVEITPALLKKKFKGAATYDSATATLTLAYDFKSIAQLKDFDLEKGKAGVNGGFLQLPPKGRAQHNVKFSDVSVTGVMYVPSMRGAVLNTTEGINVSLGGLNPDTIYMDYRKTKTRFLVPASDRTGYIPFELKITISSMYFGYGKYHVVIGTSPHIHAGFIAFEGGDNGFMYGQLTFTGKIDADWATTFFANQNK